jgi:hypothetical protein
VFRLASAIALAILAAVADARAAGDLVRFTGGGPAKTDCMLVTDVAGVATERVAHCTDGDPACDADATENGTCAFQVRLCIDTAPTTTCASEPVAHVELPPLTTLAPLATAVGTLAMPVDAPGACTGMATVAVPRRGRGAGRVVIRARATMASGHADRDRVALVCRSPGPPATFAVLQRTIFNTGCATLSCHGTARAGALDLRPESAYASLVGVLADNPVARAAGTLRVVPGDPERSFLVAKLRGTLVDGEGTRMPQVGPPLPAAKIDLVRRWIAAGAPF